MVTLYEAVSEWQELFTQLIALFSFRDWLSQWLVSILATTTPSEVQPSLLQAEIVWLRRDDKHLQIKQPPKHRWRLVVQAETWLTWSHLNENKTCKMDRKCWTYHKSQQAMTKTLQQLQPLRLWRQLAKLTCCWLNLVSWMLCLVTWARGLPATTRKSESKLTEAAEAEFEAAVDDEATEIADC